MEQLDGINHQGIKNAYLVILIVKVVSVFSINAFARLIDKTGGKDSEMTNMYWMRTSRAHA